MIKKKSLDFARLVRLTDKWLDEPDVELRQDMRQSIILMMLESQKREGLAYYPGAHYCKKVAKARSGKHPSVPFLSVDDLIGEQTLSLSYFTDFEYLIDALRTMRAGENKQVVRRAAHAGRLDLRGMVFGDWVAKDDAGINKHGKVIWSIVCTKCGEKRTALAAHLKRGAVKWCTKDRSGRSAAYAAKASAQAAINRRARRESTLK